MMTLLKDTKPVLHHGAHAKKWLATVGAIALAGCAVTPGPSVPSQPGKNLTAARDALQSCSPVAPKGGTRAVTGSYVAGFLLGGIIVGPIIVASNQENIRANGEARAVDKCLAKKGYVRRDLTPAEIQALNAGDSNLRYFLLDHLVKGGTLENFKSGV